MITRFRSALLQTIWPYCLLLIILIPLLVGCIPAAIPAAGGQQEGPAPSASLTTAPSAQDPIILPLTAYILDDSTGERSSRRTVKQVQDIMAEVNAIWADSGIIIDLRAVHRVPIPPAYLAAVSSNDPNYFFNGVVNREINLPDPSLINAFYASDIGGANGVTPFRSRTFFVTDFPSVHDERVTSHEIGHILGLHHVLDDPEQLMYSGTNGMGISDEEIAAARYAAKGLLAGVR